MLCGASLQPFSGRGAGAVPKSRTPKKFAGAAGRDGQHIPQELRQRREERAKVISLLRTISRLHKKRVPLTLGEEDAPEGTSTLVSKHLGELTEIAKSSADTNVRAAAVFLISIPSRGSSNPSQTAREIALRKIVGTSAYSDTRDFARARIREGMQ